MYFDISPLALSFDHCAYLAEKRYYFRAGEYFSQQDTTTPDSRNESTPSADTSVSAETSAAATKIIRPLRAIFSRTKKATTAISHG